MSQRISDGIIGISTGWVALSGVILFLLFSALVLPQQATLAKKETGSSQSPDMSLIYSPADLYSLAESYGERGRQAYIRARFTFDLAWPLVYTFFLTTSISWVFGRTVIPRDRWKLVNLTPLLAALCDYLENVSASLVMHRYPEQTALMAFLAPGFTALKWGLLAASFMLLIGGLFGATWYWIKRR
jgi:hypothetical protein